MKTITKTELDTLKEYLGTKPFRYEEVYNEVIDHYATAYEQSDLGLYDVIREQDKHFTDKKIREIDQLFIKDVKRQLYKAHLGLFIGYFKWPQFLMTLGVSLLFFLAGPIFFNYQIVAQTLFVVFYITPYLFMFYVMFVSRRMDRKLPGKIVNGKLSQVGRLGLYVIFYFILDRLYLRVIPNPEESILEDNMYLTSFVLLLGFAICWSSYQLFRLKFKPVLA
ncbi:hypothetical protein [Marinoscillum pacificum]|uniref:hypothetical protein n=1 Tax=Marinoscillum pacificum TaxID=392723 RepID=UPI00215726D6|nr:hypothetical protein [Marinoscillum pacificum]